MVKKRVSKDYSSRNIKHTVRTSSKHVSKINKKVEIKPKKQEIYHKPRKHHKIIKSLVKSKARHNIIIKAKAGSDVHEQIIAREKSLIVREEIPIIKPVEIEKPKQIVEEIKPVEEVKITDPILQPIQTNNVEVRVEIPKFKESEPTKGVKTTVLTVAVLILLFWTVLISASIVTNIDRTVERNTTVTVIAPIDLNLARYVYANTSLENTGNSIIGYLREEETNEGALISTKFYVVDDYGNKIRLILDGQEVKKYDLIFLTGITSEKTYNITGRFIYNQYNAQKYTFDVDEIIRQDKPMREIKTQRLENVTIEGKGFRIDITHGIKKLLGKE
jgi:hypothetical protein